MFNQNILKNASILFHDSWEKHFEDLEKSLKKYTHVSVKIVAIPSNKNRATSVTTTTGLIKIFRENLKSVKWTA